MSGLGEKNSDVNPINKCGSFLPAVRTGVKVLRQLVTVEEAHSGGNGVQSIAPTMKPYLSIYLEAVLKSLEFKMLPRLQFQVRCHIGSNSLSISATDCIDCDRTIWNKTIEVVILYADNRQEKAIIDLYREIVPKLYSHERRGPNIIANFAKKDSNIEFTRLTECERSSQFIVSATSL